MIKRIVTWVFITLFLFIGENNVPAQPIKNIGVPYVENYTKLIYRSGNQNWSVTKDKKGIMYFGNTQGVLTFDGVNWQQHKMPGDIIVRAVAADTTTGVIYTGGLAEIGYWKHNEKGIFTYYSLINLLSSADTLKDEIWKIYIDGDRVLFQSFSSIFIYEKGNIKKVKTDTNNALFFLLKAGDRFFVQIFFTKGLYELKGDKLEHLANSDALPISSEDLIVSILPYKENQLLIGTSKSGLYLYTGNAIVPWKTPANEYLKANHLNNGTIVNKKYFVYGTILNGVIILDEAGNIIQKINKGGGLQNNTILSLYVDEAQNLWTGLDNGISRIELNSPLYFYLDNSGKLGTVYSGILFKNKVYLATNHGLFYSQWLAPGDQSFHAFDFTLVPNSQGQVWELTLIDGQLFCGHNDATFLVNDKSITRISDVQGGWTIKKLKSDPNLLIQGYYNGLALYKFTGGQWTFDKRLRGFTEASRYVEQDNKGQIWSTNPYKGIYKIVLSKDQQDVNSVKSYDEKSGLPTTYGINVFSLENQMVFSSEKGFYVHDDISDKFNEYSFLNKSLGSFAFSNKVIPAGNKKYWFIHHSRVALADFSQAGKIAIDSGKFSVLTGKMVQSYENISKIGDAGYLISMDDGFATLNDSVLETEPEVLPQVLISKIENTSGNIYTISEYAEPGKNIEISNKKNNIRISFAFPYYKQANIKYSFFLEGYSDQWSEWNNNTVKEFTNLPPGTYHFKVMAKVNDVQVSGISSMEFTVLPPWYATKPALALYLLLSICLAVVLRKLYKLRIEKHKIEIEKKLREEKEEQLKQEIITNEQRIIKLKNEQLQLDLERKSRQLSNSAMNLISKNELLQKIQEELNELKDNSGQKISENQQKKIQKVIDEGINDQRDWDLFEQSFNDAHENFFKKIKANYPDLVPNDLKLCAYLRMSMSSKEMASLLNISLKSVEIRRYRLRRKLNLDHNKNLVEFLMEI
ncbi:triple tyrosine motif-containing protein [Chitinophagaceae bacterium LWZ2-11]